MSDFRMSTTSGRQCTVKSDKVTIQLVWQKITCIQTSLHPYLFLLALTGHHTEAQQPGQQLRHVGGRAEDARVAADAAHRIAVRVRHVTCHGNNI